MKDNAATQGTLSSWESVKICDAYRFTKKPRDLKPPDEIEVPFIPMDLIPQGGNTKVGFIKKTMGTISSGTYFERGDILLSKITPSFENGKQGIADDIPSAFGYATTEVIPIQAIPGMSSKHFLFYYLLDPDIRRQIADKMEGSTGRQRVPEAVIKEWTIPLPPLEEQKRIASVLWKIQQAIEVESNLIRVTRELKAAVMKKLFTEGLNGEPQKETQIGMVPQSWEVARLGSVAKFQGGYAFKSGSYVNEGVRLLRISNVSFGHADWTDTASLPENMLTDFEDYSLKTSDIVMAMTRPVVSGGIKVATLKSSDVPALLNQRVGRFRVSGKIVDRFLYQIVFSDNFVNSINTYADGSQQPNISAGQIESILIPLPSSNHEQTQIAQYLDSVDSSLETHTMKRNLLQEMFQSVLRTLMSGTVRLGNSNLDAALFDHQGVTA